MSIHYRILRDRSSRDDDAMIAPVVVHGAPWVCACGTTNDDDWDNCMYCNVRRGDWNCDRCGHLNPKREDACEGCGYDKPEGDE